jgi:hypothetical protein
MYGLYTYNTNFIPLQSVPLVDTNQVKSYKNQLMLWRTTLYDQTYGGIKFMWRTAMICKLHKLDATL